LTVLVLLWGGAGPAKADIIFSNFGPGDGYNTQDGPVIGQTSPRGNRVEEAAAFTVTGGSFTLDRIELAASLYFGPNRLDVALAVGAGGLPNFPIIAGGEIDNMMGPLGVTNPPLVLDSPLHPILLEGQQYWLIVSVPPDQPEVVFWNYNAINDSGPTATSVNGGAWSADDLPFQETFRVTGTPVVSSGPVAVPEPSTLALLTVGALALGAAGWRRRRGTGGVLP
jgi:hypothetical protein